MRKKAVGLGLFLLTTGLAILVFPTPHTSTVDISRWDFPVNTLDPQKTTFYAQSMSPGNWFQLNVTATNLVELQISGVSQSGTVKTPVFTDQGTRFTQKVSVALTGSYEVDVTNISSSTITLSGCVLAQKSVADNAILGPYASLGFLVMLVGLTVLCFGLLTKSKTRLKSKDLKKRART